MSGASAPRRRGGVLSQRCAGARDGEEVEDPPAAVVEQHDRQLQPQSPGREQTADVVGQRDVADQERDRPLVRRRRGAEGARDGPVDPVGAPVAEHPGRVWADGPEALDVPHGHRGGDEQGRTRRHQHSQLGGHGRLGEPRRSDHARDRLGGALVGAAPAGPASPRRTRRTACARRSSASAGSSGKTRRQHAGGILPGALRVERDLGGAGQRGQPAAQRLGDRKVADPDDEVRREAVEPRLVPEDRVVVGDRRLAAARAGERVGEQRPARRAAPAPPRAGRAAARARGDRRRRSPRRELVGEFEQRLHVLVGRRHRMAADVGAPVRSAAGVGRQLVVADQRLAQREVQVNRSRARPRSTWRRRGRPAS